LRGFYTTWSNDIVTSTARASSLDQWGQAQSKQIYRSSSQQNERYKCAMRYTTQLLHNEII